MGFTRIRADWGSVCHQNGADCCMPAAQQRMSRAGRLWKKQSRTQRAAGEEEGRTRRAEDRFSCQIHEAAGRPSMRMLPGWALHCCTGNAVAGRRTYPQPARLAVQSHPLAPLQPIAQSPRRARALVHPPIHSIHSSRPRERRLSCPHFHPDRWPLLLCFI